MKPLLFTILWIVTFVSSFSLIVLMCDGYDTMPIKIGYCVSVFAVFVFSAILLHIGYNEYKK